MSKPIIPSRAFLSAFPRALNATPLSTTRSFSSKCLRATQTEATQGLSRGGYGRGGYGRGGYGRREFSASATKQFKTVEEARSRHKSGPFSWKAGVIYLVAGVGLVVYFRYEKDRIARQRVAEAAKGVGKPKVGGRFELVDQEGRPVTDQDLLGRYSLVYFGFSHCPDICPEELDKMSTMIDLVNNARPNTMRPVFITCDPARDTPAVLKTYLSEFHPSLIGLTGTWEQVKAVCKAYRVYFSTPKGVKPGQDYLVDHSIYFYLMDPEGDFVEAIGRQHSPEQAARIILDHMGDWKGKIE